MKGLVQGKMAKDVSSRHCSNLLESKIWFWKGIANFKRKINKKKCLDTHKYMLSKNIFDIL